jgi:hypothetical protein
VDKNIALEELKKLAKSRDTEAAHSQADAILLALIDDTEIDDAYGEVPKWYA